MKTLVLALVLGIAAFQEAGQERPKVPDDSVELVVSGCLKGRVSPSRTPASPTCRAARSSAASRSASPARAT